MIYQVKVGAQSGASANSLTWSPFGNILEKLLDSVTNWKHSEFVGSAPVRRDKMEDWGIRGSTLQVTTGDLAVLSRLPSLAHSSYIQITEA